MPTPLNNSTVAGLMWNRIGTSTVAPNMANRCCRLSGMVCSNGGRSLTPMARRVIIYPLVLFIPRARASGTAAGTPVSLAATPNPFGDLFCQKSRLSGRLCDLFGSENLVPGIAEPGNDVTLLIQSLIH